MEKFILKKLDCEIWEKDVDTYIRDYFSTYSVFDRDGHAIDSKNLFGYIDTICVNDVLSDIYTGTNEFFEGVGICEISLYDEFANELENKLIGKFYQLNKNKFKESLEDFTDYLLSEHTYLLYDYIYHLLDNCTSEKLKKIILDEE